MLTPFAGMRQHGRGARRSVVVLALGLLLAVGAKAQDVSVPAGVDSSAVEAPVTLDGEPAVGPGAVAVPVEARTWARNRRERTCAVIERRLGSDQAG